MRAPLFAVLILSVAVYGCGGGGGGTPPSSNNPPATTPNAPTSFNATPTSSVSVNAEWVDASANETSFEIGRAPTGGTTFTVVGTVAANTTTFTDTGLTASTPYDYCVRSKNGTLVSVWSNIVTATTQPAATTAPNAPSGLMVTGTGNDSLSATWLDNATNEDGYTVWHATGTTPGAYSQIGIVAPNVTSYTATGLPEGTHWIKVQATNSVNTSAFSNEASVVLPPPVTGIPNAPTNFRLVSVTGRDLLFAWDDNSSDELEFDIMVFTDQPTAGWREEARFASNVTLGGGNSFVMNMVPGEPQLLYVHARNAAGASAPSNVLSFIAP